MEVRQLAKQIPDLPGETFTANTKNHPKENCSVVVMDYKTIEAKQEGLEDSEEEEMKDEACQEKLKDLPRKEVDPGVVVLPVSIGNMEIDNGLIYLVASVNIMLFSLVD